MTASTDGRQRGKAPTAPPAGGGFQKPMIDLLHHASVEVSPHAHKAAGLLRDKFDPGTDVFISFLPTGDYKEVVKTAAALRHAGFNPVPHVPARSILNLPQLDDFLTRLSAEANVTRALLIAGDLDHPAGPFASTMGLLRTDLFAARGIRSVGFAGHPEGHVSISPRALDLALTEKLEFAASSGLSPFLVTQFCFEPDPVIAWLRNLSRAHWRGRAGNGGDPDPLRHPLRHRQFDAGNPEPDQCHRPPAWRNRAAGRVARDFGGAGGNAAQPGVRRPFLPLWRHRQDKQLDRRNAGPALCPDHCSRRPIGRRTRGQGYRFVTSS